LNLNSIQNESVYYISNIQQFTVGKKNNERETYLTKTLVERMNFYYHPYYSFFSSLFLLLLLPFTFPFSFPFLFVESQNGIVYGGGISSTTGIASLGNTIYTSISTGGIYSFSPGGGTPTIFCSILSYPILRNNNHIIFMGGYGNSINSKFPLLVTSFSSNAIGTGSIVQISSGGVASIYIPSGNFLSGPVGIVMDSNGIIYVSSPSENAITRFLPGVTTATGYWIQDGDNLIRPMGKLQKRINSRIFQI
jgi:hypothetical protein